MIFFWKFSKKKMKKIFLQIFFSFLISIYFLKKQYIISPAPPKRHSPCTHRVPAFLTCSARRNSRFSWKSDRDRSLVVLECSRSWCRLFWSTCKQKKIEFMQKLIRKSTDSICAMSSCKNAMSRFANISTLFVPMLSKCLRANLLNPSRNFSRILGSSKIGSLASTAQHNSVSRSSSRRHWTSADAKSASLNVSTDFRRDSGDFRALKWEKMSVLSEISKFKIWIIWNSKNFTRIH